MKTAQKRMLFGLLALTFIALMVSPAFAGDEVTIMGTINADNQIVTEDNQVFAIGDNEKGDELVGMLNKKVKVTGMVEEEGDARTIMVDSYEVISE
jgi:hypothetical protein